jgi:hypothetical protein
VLSGCLHWAAVRGIHGPWIVPDELIYAARGLQFWHEGPASLLRGSDAGYGLLYPMVAGVPLSLGRTTQAYDLLKLVQPFVVSLAAVPVFVYSRRLMPVSWALVAAALTCASPLLLYSGFVMTEVLFYPLSASTLFAIAYAVETGTERDQGLALVLILAAVLTRSQAVLFAAVLPTAAALEAVMSRDFGRLRRFWPSALVLACGVVALAAFPGLVGAYGETLRNGYPFVSGLRLTLDHLAYVALSVAIVPAAALIALSIDAFRGSEAAASARALLAVTIAAVAGLALQVGFFAARYAPHLLGRDLTPLPPLLFTVFALWLSRGAPRRLLAAAVGAYGLLALILLVPWNTLVASVAFPDSFDLIVIAKVPWSAATTIMVVAIVVLTAFVFLPRRPAVVVLPALTLLVLIASSAVAARELRRTAHARSLEVVGVQPDWIDRSVHGPVAYVYGGEQLWTAPWLERFWNRRIDEMLTLGGTRIPGPIAQRLVTLPANGVLPTRNRYVVAADRFTFVGTKLAHLAQSGVDVTGLTLWRLEGPPRVSTITQGVQPNGDMTHPATVSVYDCRRGELRMTLIPKASPRLVIRLDGRPALDTPISGFSWTGSVPVPPSRDARLCTFTIYPQPLLGSTAIAFSRS